MDPNRERNIVPRSFFRLPESFPSFSFPSFPTWEEMTNQLSEFGGNTGVSVSEDDKNVYVEAQLPGLKPDDVDISINRNTLWIKGEKKEEEENKDKKFYRRARNSFFYQVDLPSQIEENSEQAQFQDGILKVAFKKAQQSQVRKISIGGKSK